MPTVPVYGPRRAQLTGVPGARLTASETDVSSGAALAREQARTAGVLGEAARVGAGVATAVVDKHRRDAEEIAELEWQNRFDDFEKHLHDPETGAFNIRGKASFELPEKVDEDFATFAGDLAAGVPKNMLPRFERLRQSREQNIALAIRRHVSGEIQAFEATELKATLANAVNLAGQNAMDPRRVGELLDRGEGAIRAAARRRGEEDTEATTAMVGSFRSDGHLSVIANLVEDGHERAADAYFEETKSEIAGDRWDDVTRLLNEGKLTKQAQEQTDRILAEGGTLADQRTKAKQIEDSKLRDEVLRRLEHEEVVRDANERKADEGRMTNAANIIDNGGGYDSIPAADRAQMSPSQRSSLRNYYDQVTRGIDPETHWPSYYGLFTKAAENPDAFMRENLLNYRDKLSDGDFRTMANLQLSMRNGESDDAQNVLAGFSTKGELIDNTLGQYGIDPKAKPGSAEGNAIAQLRRMIDRRIDALQAGGQKVTNTEIQNVIATVLGQSVDLPTSWWNIWPGGRPSPLTRDTETKRLIDVTIDDVPTADRTEIERLLREEGLPVTDATILDTYLEGAVK